MALAAKPAMPDLREGAAPLDGHEAQAVIAIDAEAAEILSANASGAAALGLFPYASFPIALDPAMPAVARLRQIAVAGGIGKADPETLLFWKSGQLRRVKCRVAKQGKNGSKVLLLHVVEVETPPDVASAQPLISSAASAFAGGGMEVLREIAEQLRQARAGGLSASRIFGRGRVGPQAFPGVGCRFSRETRPRTQNAADGHCCGL